MTDDDGKQNRDERGKFTKGNQIGRKFERGQAANPDGRNAFGVKVSAILKRRLSETLPDMDNQTIAEAVAEKLITMALAGDLNALKELIDRTEGRTPQTVDMDVSVKDWRQTVESFDISMDELTDEINKLLSSGTDDGTEHN